MKYIDYIKLFENKDRFFDKNETLNNKEKEFYKKFFKEHPEQGNKIKNWNLKLTKEDFDKVIYDYDNNFSKLPTDKFSDLIKGEDYDYLGEFDGYKLYFIYTFKASVTIASNNVTPEVWSPLPSWYSKSNSKDDYIYDRASNLYSGAKWCTAMNHSDFYFNDYIKGWGVSYIYCVASDSSLYNTLLEPEYKLAAVVYFNGKIKKIYDAYDQDYDNTKFTNDLAIFIENNFNTFAACCDKLKDSIGYEEKPVESSLVDNEEEYAFEDDEEEYLGDYLSIEGLSRMMNQPANIRFVRSQLTSYFNDDQRVLVADGIIDFINLVGHPVNIFLDTIGTSYMESHTNGEIIEIGEVFINKYIEVQDRSCLGAFSSDTAKIRCLKNMFGQDNTKESRGSSIFYKHFIEDSDTQSYSLLDFLSCSLDMLTNLYTSYGNGNYLLSDTLSALFRNNDKLYAELKKVIQNFNAGDIRSKIATAGDTVSWYHCYVVGGEYDSSEDLLSLLLKIHQVFQMNFSNTSNELDKSDDVSLKGYGGNNANKLNGFFASIAKVLFEYMQIDSALWWNALAINRSFQNDSYSLISCYPIVTFGYYAYDKYAIEQLLGKNNNKYYLREVE